VPKLLTEMKLVQPTKSHPKNSS